MLEPACTRMRISYQVLLAFKQRSMVMSSSNRRFCSCWCSMFLSPSVSYHTATSEPSDRGTPDVATLHVSPSNSRQRRTADHRSTVLLIVMFYCVLLTQRRLRYEYASLYTVCTRYQHDNASTGWFKLNDGNVFPGRSPCCFFESDREIRHVFYKPLRRPDLTCFFSFCMIFRLP